MKKKEPTARKDHQVTTKQKKLNQKPWAIAVKNELEGKKRSGGWFKLSKTL